MNHVGFEKANRAYGEGRARETCIIKSVLFVCAGNVCRSPACHGVMQSLVVRKGLKGKVKVDSAGVLDDRLGEKANWRMRWVSFLRGYRLRTRSRLINRLDLDRFDLVIALDRSVLSDLQRIHSRPRCELRLLSDFLPDQSPRDVPDPVNRPMRDFRSVLDVIERACPRILDALVGEEAAASQQFLPGNA